MERQLTNTILQLYGNSTDSGMYGEYFRLTKKLGIKVLRTHSKRAYANANIEFQRQNKFKALVESKTRLKVPKAHGVLPVQVGNTKFWGILMDHVPGYTPTYEEADKVLRSLERIKVNKHDCHNQNMIFNKKGKWIIDFGVCN